MISTTRGLRPASTSVLSPTVMTSPSLWTGRNGSGQVLSWSIIGKVVTKLKLIMKIVREILRTKVILSCNSAQEHWPGLPSQRSRDLSLRWQPETELQPLLHCWAGPTGALRETGPELGSWEPPVPDQCPDLQRHHHLHPTLPGGTHQCQPR